MVSCLGGDGVSCLGGDGGRTPPRRHGTMCSIRSLDLIMVVYDHLGEGLHDIFLLGTDSFYKVLKNPRHPLREL